MITHIEHQPEHYQLEINGEVVADAHLKDWNTYYFVVDLKNGPTLGTEYSMTRGQAKAILSWMDTNLAGQRG